MWTIIQAIIGSAIGTAVINLLSKYPENWISMFFEGKRQIRDDKRSIGEELIKICTEAQTHGYSEYAKDRRHIYYILNQLNGLDTEGEDALIQFYSAWNMSVFLSRLNKGETEHIRFMKETAEEAQTAAKILLKVAHRLKKS